MSLKIGYLMKANDGIYEQIRAALPHDWKLVTLHDGQTPLSAMPELDVVIAGKVTSEMIGAAPRLRLILTPGVGYDGIDLPAASAHAIPVANTVCGNTIEVAEATLMLMLAVSRRLTELDAALRQGKWMMWDRRLQSRNLAGRTLGLIGFGRIGQEVAARAAAFNMRVIYHDPVQTPAWDWVTLERLLDESDYVSLHVPLTSSTRGLLTRDRIFAMKRGAVLINTARGEVVDESGLVEALQSGHLSGAGLDVFANEPPESGNPLLGMANVVLMPHVASGTLDGLHLKAAQYAENIRRCFAGEPLIDSIQDTRKQLVP
ncbi:MAG TPA: 2-hydroxyacid dehydrogenase [Bryobacteraceae bacterium]|nr:2-hydroxyacid dehydrogenase [Bryobacteraceae bacterium]